MRLRWSVYVAIYIIVVAILNCLCIIFFGSRVLFPIIAILIVPQYFVFNPRKSASRLAVFILTPPLIYISSVLMLYPLVKIFLPGLI